MNERGERCVYDPLAAFMSHYADATSDVRGTQDDRKAMPIEQRLAARIVDGDRVGLEDDLREALVAYSPLDIINGILLDGMKTVGELFGSGQMQLPFVLQSAEVMKGAVAFLEPMMERSSTDTRGVMVLATVKGDVHDIGKNLVDIILTNNGYRVINLGIKAPIENMLTAIEEHQADALGMSGLLVKSTLIMKENLELMKQRGISIPVVLGGAALTRRYVEEDLRPLYSGRLAYARDAFDGLRFMELATTPPSAMGDASAPGDEVDGAAGASGAESSEFGAMRAAVSPRRAKGTVSNDVQSGELKDAVPALVRSAVSRIEQLPSPPFYGSKVVTGIAIDKVYEYINEAALVRGQWQFRRGRKSVEEQERELHDVVRPKLEELKLRLKRDAVLRPAVVYGYFPCAADGNDLIVYRPEDIEEGSLHTVWPESLYGVDQLVEWQRFSFPRQGGDRYLCIADYFRTVDDGVADVCAFHLVTMGEYASEYTASLFQEDRYQEYLYVHGLSVECAEALAEYWHRSIRIELGIAGRDAPDLRKLFSQGYQGSRYSFGYPACPKLEDHEQLFALLAPERIGVSLTEEYQLVPEQSTSAIIVHHPEAKYFNVNS
jgi:5-methyltetrahydrofolate--homocysteine methyltransferase